MPDPGSIVSETFDYIVVGAGTAGCILAARLAEEPHTRVALLEAGSAGGHPLCVMPLGFGKALSRETLTWQFSSEPQGNLDGRSLNFPRGRMLGGTSAINGMVHTRGFVQDFDDWAARGCDGWSFAEVEKYFGRAEKRLGCAGEMPRLGDTPLIASAFIEACKASVVGQSEVPNVAIRKGKRLSARRAVPKSVRIIKGCRVERVILHGGRATGVEAFHLGQHMKFEARAEVLLCAGSILSPNILFHSGVGDSGVLRENGIDPAHHLPGVGHNLQDHFGVAMAWEARGTRTLNELAQRPLSLVSEAVRWFLTGRGALGRPLAEALCFAETDTMSDRPDVEIILRVMNGTGQEGLSPRPAFSLNAFPLRPESRGQIRPRGNDPCSAPHIDPNYLAAGQDIDASLRAMKLAKRLVESPHMAPFRKSEILPGPGVETDSALLNYLKKSGASASHHVGSCQMGMGDGSVVDSKLRVRGISSLRVVDASVMPTIPAAHPNAIVMMIAEKAGDLIARGEA